jgi:hypothetical protein
MSAIHRGDGNFAKSSIEDSELPVFSDCKDKTHEIQNTLIAAKSMLVCAGRCIE